MNDNEDSQSTYSIHEKRFSFSNSRRNQNHFFFITFSHHFTITDGVEKKTARSKKWTDQTLINRSSFCPKFKGPDKIDFAVNVTYQSNPHFWSAFAINKSRSNLHNIVFPFNGFKDNELICKHGVFECNICDAILTLLL
jgi:hypothetical protein